MHARPFNFELLNSWHEVPLLVDSDSFQVKYSLMKNSEPLVIYRKDFVAHNASLEAHVEILVLCYQFIFSLASTINV